MGTRRRIGGHYLTTTYETCGDRSQTKLSARASVLRGKLFKNVKRASVIGLRVSLGQFRRPTV